MEKTMPKVNKIKVETFCCCCCATTVRNVTDDDDIYEPIFGGSMINDVTNIVFVCTLFV